MGLVCYCRWLFLFLLSAFLPLMERFAGGSPALRHPLALPCSRAQLGSRQGFLSLVPSPLSAPHAWRGHAGRQGRGHSKRSFSAALCQGKGRECTPCLFNVFLMFLAERLFFDMLSLPAGANAARASRLAGCRLAHTRVPSFPRSPVYLCHSPGSLRRFHTRTSTQEVSVSSKTKPDSEANGLSSCQHSPSACLPNYFYFMPLWQSHPIRLKYPGLERLSPESFSKGASHRPLNPPHFMVQIFNSSERGTGGEAEENSYKSSGCSSHRPGS